ncbi:MAG TPA: hypothetical protein VMW20_07300 [Candidatus Nanoarchaeia archaeon]|nr:hypothetical protein [Candidatus Nanoarchaeia archaeon]
MNTVRLAVTVRIAHAAVWKAVLAACAVSTVMNVFGSAEIFIGLRLHSFAHIVSLSRKTDSTEKWNNKPKT